jgi:gliding motility-associated lipoprotein GldH
MGEDNINKFEKKKKKKGKKKTGRSTVENTVNRTEQNKTVTVENTANRSEQTKPADANMNEQNKPDGDENIPKRKEKIRHRHRDRDRDSKKIVPVILALVSLCFTACDPARIYESNVKIAGNGWHRSEIVRFETEITDIDIPYNIYINVRNNTDYKYMELWLFVDVHSPSGVIERDTAKVMLADHRGKWLGKGLGSKFDTRLFFRKNVRFPEAGKYIFEYEQATRDETLPGIDDIGLRIEKANI